jgi:riboflavin synthase
MTEEAALGAASLLSTLQLSAFFLAMFTGIVQGVATVAAITDRPGLRSFTLQFPPGFCTGLEIGASVACDGVCLTVTALKGPEQADFDVMQQSLALTTLGDLKAGSRINVERAAKDGAEIGGHPLSGHVDVSARIAEIRKPDNNHVIRFAVPAPWMRYVFAKGYIGVNGCSLTVAEAQRERDGSGWFEVWLIPETLRMTTFSDKDVGARLNIEIERQTQVFVDTVRDAIEEKLGPLLPALEKLLAEQGQSLQDLAEPARLAP